ncbi:hypothetical protein CK203_101240 [Vitis vinifera]|uniref:Uncharacterized protein n=1 Tax=Vitis vinifera TaxID=29760 RepID=A0A438DC45_VITVI|nr:hypothetical protein CK203_101240 [Vitis vinifera]
MLESAPFATPMVVKDISSNSAPVNAILFRNMVGALQYFTFTRLDITFVVNKVSQFLDWASCTTTKRSITGFYTFLGSNCIFGMPRNNPATVSPSSIEVEYRSMASTIV